MKTLLVFLTTIFFAFNAFAQTATPTITPDGRRSGDAIRTLYFPMVTVLPTAVPTAYITPAHVVNTGFKFRRLAICNDLNCDIEFSPDGLTSVEIIKAGQCWEDNLARDKRYYQGSVYVRGNSACTSGNLHVSGRD